MTRDLNGALTDVQERITAVLERLGPYYARPKFQTVASNLLQESLRYMYAGGGEEAPLVLAGSPEIRPYHVLHLFDDARQMHGPAECGGVLHRFGPEGFYTVALPRLATGLRGADAAMDVAWMGFASEYYAFASWLSRAGSLAGTAAGVGFRAAIYRGVGRFLTGRPAARFLLGLGMRGAARIAMAFSGAGTALAVGDLLYSTLGYLYEGGQEKAQHFVGVMTGDFFLGGRAPVVVPTIPSLSPPFQRFTDDWRKRSGWERRPDCDPVSALRSPDGRRRAARKFGAGRPVGGAALVFFLLEARWEWVGFLHRSVSVHPRIA